MEVFHKLKLAASLVDWKTFGMRPFLCPLCGPSMNIQLNASAIGVRCLRCAASAITMSLVSVLKAEIGDLIDLHLYELSSRGPLARWLRRRAGRFTCSEYFDSVPSGEMLNGILCQDVQRLTFSNESFDLCTSTEVFEHVPDDSRGFAELHRVLRPGGRLIFSVPITPMAKTVERAVMEQGTLRHLLPPEYHGDRIRGQGQVLVYRDYGLDIVDRVKAVGFHEARLVDPPCQLRGWGCPIIVATA